MVPHRIAILLAAPIILAAGCGEMLKTSVTSSSDGTATNLTEAPAEQLVKDVEKQKGKVVLIDFWATWCAPCVKKFPDFVSLHKKYADRGLVCMSISLDPRGNHDKYNKQEVQQFLNEKGANFANYVLLGYAKDQARIENYFGLEGGIPFMVLFDKEGRRVWTSEEKRLSNSDLEKLIEEQLAK